MSCILHNSKKFKNLLSRNLFFTKRSIKKGKIINFKKDREGDGGTFPGMNKKGGRYQLFNEE
jgi:hypothetical protein